MLNHKDEPMGTKKSFFPPDHIGGFQRVEQVKIATKVLLVFFSRVCMCVYLLGRKSGKDGFQ